MVIGIIGGGASGMTAALWASRNPEVKVLLFERQARVGRKLLATGNGRCNLSNRNTAPNSFHGEDPSFASHAIEHFSPEDTLAWFRSLGLLTVSEASGRVYPYSDQANSVVDVLRLGLERENITLYTGFEVVAISRKENLFLIQGQEQQFLCDRVIVACGGLAGTKLGGSLSGYKLLAKLGHRATKLRPALVQLKTDWSGVSALKGVRTNCHAQIMKDGALFSESTGELQFTQYGLSGPVIFEISRDVGQTKANWSCQLDFLPMLSEDALFQELQLRTRSQVTANDLLTGILHNRLGRVLANSVGVNLAQPVKTLLPEQLRAVSHAVKCFEISISEPLGMDCAQVTAGGVMTKDFHPETMESRLVPGLYACGEVLDIDGDCGGFNLQWAWSSGRLAGIHAGKEA